MLYGMHIPAIVDILRKLKSVGRCRVSLDLRSAYPAALYEALLSQSVDSLHQIPIFGATSVYQDVLRAVVFEAGYDVTSITIDRQQQIDLSALGASSFQRLQSSFRKTQAMVLGVGSVLKGHTISQPGSRHYNTYVPVQVVGDFYTLLHATEDLQQLRLWGGSSPISDCCQQSARPDACSIAYMLCAKPLHNLQKLQLDSVFITERTLMNTMANCIGTLKCLSLRDVWLDTTSWRGIFTHLHETRNLLEHLHLEELRAGLLEGSFRRYLFGNSGNSQRVAELEGFYEDCQFEGGSAVRDGLEALAMNRAYYQLREYDPRNESDTLEQETHGEWLSTGRGNANGFGVAALM